MSIIYIPDVILIIRPKQVSECTRTVVACTFMSAVLKTPSQYISDVQLRQDKSHPEEEKPECLAAEDDAPEAQSDGISLWLHVYDLNETTGYLNNYGLKNASLGLFHAGVEVWGQEYFFGWGETEFSGIRCNRPRHHGIHSYRESIFMGKCPLDERGIDDALDEVFQNWPESSYHPIHNNCTTFAEEFLHQLKAPEPFPEWVHGAAAVGRSEYLRPVVDWSWEWAKWKLDGDGDGILLKIARSNTDN